MNLGQDYDRVGRIMLRFLRFAPGQGALSYDLLDERLSEMKDSAHAYIDFNFDFDKFFAPHLFGGSKNYTEPHYYKYERVGGDNGISAKVQIKAKAWMHSSSLDGDSRWEQTVDSWFALTDEGQRVSW